MVLNKFNNNIINNNNNNDNNNNDNRNSDNNDYDDIIIDNVYTIKSKFSEFDKLNNYFEHNIEFHQKSDASFNNIPRAFSNIQNSSCCTLL